jgi:hypothetical protein
VSGGLDPRELKILADILALVVDNQAGQSEAALEQLRRRARSNSITGGALKGLLIRAQTLLGPDQNILGAAQDARLRAAEAQIHRLTDAAGDQQQQLRQAWEKIDHLTAENFQYQRLLSTAQEEVIKSEQRRRVLRKLKQLASGGMVLLFAAGVAIGWWCGAQRSPIFTPVAHTVAIRGDIDPESGSGQQTGSVIVAKLTPEDIAAISAHLKTCFQTKFGRAPFEIVLMATTDAGGVVRKVQVQANSADQLTDPDFQKAADRAIEVLLSPTCAKLPLVHPERQVPLAFQLSFKP